MTKAEEILEKHLAIMDAETMIGKHGRTHKAVINAINEAINYTHSCILGDLKEKTKMEIPKLIEREDKFCESIDCERTEDTKQFIYDSRNDKSVMNLPYVLLEYKQWLIDEGFIKELK